MKKLLIFLSCFLFVSCLEKEISLDDLEIQNNALIYDIVIDGMISNEKTRYKVWLNKPSSIFGEIKSEPINDASVVVRHNDVEFVYQFDSLGIYSSIDSIQGVPGGRYMIEVKYNGKIYTASDILPEYSADQFLLPLKAPSEGQSTNRISGSYDIHNFGFEKPLICLNDSRWSYNNDTVIHVDINTLNSTRAFLHKGSPPQGVFPSNWVSTGVSGRPQNVVTFVNLSISDSYYDYLISVFNETDWKGGIFSTIGGNVKTNVSEGGTGFFHCVNAKRLVLTYEELKNYIH